MSDYDIILRAPMPGTLPERIRKWFEEECPAPWLEVAPGRYVLYRRPELRQVAVDQPPRQPLHHLAGKTCVALMDEQRIVMATIRHEATDKALRAFAEWLSTQVEYDLYDGPLPIPTDDLTHPELYE